MYNLNYIEPLFRPPSEWQSLILQVTNGCSWNKCTFCEMYTLPHKKFRPKPITEIEAELQAVVNSGAPVRRVFLADGDVMTLSFRRLQEIVELVNRYFPHIQRISSYCLPRNLNNKTVDELASLRQMKLDMMYVGCESGDNLVLERVRKGETYASSLAALQKIKAAGMKSSVMILNGLGGQKYLQQHAINSARLMNEAQPEYLSTLVVSFPAGEELFREYFRNAEGHKEFVPLQQMDLFREMGLLLEHLELDSTIFRSDHASNYLVLKGILGRDKQKLLDKVNTAIHRPGVIPLRQEWQRGL